MDAAILFFLAFNPKSSHFMRNFRFDADIALILMKN